MIRTSRMVTCWLPSVLLAVLLFGIDSQCLAKHAEKQAIRIESSFGGELLDRVEFKSIDRQTSDLSNFEIAESWWRFTSHRTYHAAQAIVLRGRAIVTSCQKWQVAQQDLVRQSLNLAFESYNENRDWLATAASADWTWLPIKPTADGSEHAELRAGAPTGQHVVEEQQAEEEQADDMPFDKRSAYWTYYQDCERWGVELTHTVQHLHGSNATGLLESSSNTTDGVSQSPAHQAQQLTKINGILEQMSQWFGETMDQIEFAALESRVASRVEVVTQSE